MPIPIYRLRGNTSQKTAIFTEQIWHVIRLVTRSQICTWLSDFIFLKAKDVPQFQMKWHDISFQPPPPPPTSFTLPKNWPPRTCAHNPYKSTAFPKLCTASPALLTPTPQRLQVSSAMLVPMYQLHITSSNTAIYYLRAPCLIMSGTMKNTHKSSFAQCVRKSVPTGINGTRTDRRNLNSRWQKS